MPSVFHIALAYEKKTYYENNLTEGNVKTIIENYKKNINFYFDGKIIFPKRVEQIRIFSTDEETKNNFEVVHYGKNVTKDYLNEIPNFAKSSEVDLNIEITKEGIYLKGHPFDALRKVHDLLKSAKKNIILIDGYINDDNLGDLCIKNQGVTIKILTFNLSRALLNSATAFNGQYGGLEIHTAPDFHDRFLIIDETDFYHFGASLKDLAQKKGFMFSQIEEDLIKKILLDTFNDIWNNHSTKII